MHVVMWKQVLALNLFISRYSLNQSNFQAEDLPRSEANHTGDNNHKKHEYKNVDSLNP